MDAKTISLIEMRLKYSWIVWFIGILMLILFFLFNGKIERIMIFGIGLILIQISGPFSYRKALMGGEGYHFMFRQTIDINSSFGLILACIIFEVFVLMVLLLYLMVGLNGVVLT
jgi:hypothetical protein